DTSNTNFSTVTTALARNPWAAGKKVYISSGYNGSTYLSNTPETEIFNLAGPLMVIGGYIQFGGNSYVCYKLENDGNLIINSVWGDTMNSAGGIYQWRTSGSTTGSSHVSYPFFLPDPYLAFYDSTNAWIYTNKAGNGQTIFTFPTSFYIDQRLRLSFKISSSGQSNPYVRWAVYYIR
ncbi:hypothetical protein, partial [Heliobacterium chlorum]|uniref:hypothetical protein n=1 Tax=Heliobacterium chlorum TaxID=2698 RepID=UPI001A9B4A88